MTTMPKSLLWARADTAGTDHALIDDRRGIHAHGTALAATPIPYTCRYELTTDDTWATTRLEVQVEGAGWLRSLRMEHAAGRWRASTAEQGDLDAALRTAGHAGAGLPGIEDPGRLEAVLDVDLAAAPLFNTVPVRRLGLLNAAPGTEQRITVAWVLLPSLEVLPAEQVYTVLANGNLRFASDSFTTEIELDLDGYVTRYPGLAARAAAAR